MIHALSRFGGAGDDGVQVTGEIRRDGARFAVTFRLDAAPGAVVLPPAVGAPVRRDRLWERTCFEVFAAVTEATDYWEVNLSPSGDWNIYHFDRYRSGMTAAAQASVQPTTLPIRRANGGVHLAATVDLGERRPAALPALDLSLTAVIEHAGGQRSYWALAHVAAQPDFHQRESFILRVPAEGRHP